MLKTNNFRAGCQLWIGHDKLPSFSFLKLRKPKRRGHKRFRQLWERSRVGREFENVQNKSSTCLISPCSHVTQDITTLQGYKRPSSLLSFLSDLHLVSTHCRIALAHSREYFSYIKDLFNCPLFWQNSLILIGRKKKNTEKFTIIIIPIVSYCNYLFILAPQVTLTWNRVNA